MEQKLKLIVYNMEKFKVGVVQNNLGLIPLDNILDIHININLLKQNVMFTDVSLKADVN